MESDMCQKKGSVGIRPKKKVSMPRSKTADFFCEPTTGIVVVPFFVPLTLVIHKSGTVASGFKADRESGQKICF